VTALRSLSVATLGLLGWAAAGAAHAAGSASVRSSIDGEPILLDGADTGLTTPAVVRNISPGRHVFTVGGPCRAGTADVIIPDGPKVVVQIESVATTGTLQVQPRPAGATVRLDNQPLDSLGGPAEVACGDHNLAVQMPGYIPAFLKIEVGGGERVVLPVELEPLGMGALTLSVSPDGATVLLDGAVINPAGQKVPAGVHVLQVSADGHTPQERQFVLNDGEEVALTFDLEPEGGAVAVAPTPKPTPTPPAPRDPNSWWNLPHTGGVVAGAAGVGLGIVAAIELAEMGRMGREYSDRVDTVNATRDYSIYAPSYANAYRDDQLVPQRNKAVGLTALSAVLLGSGLTLTLAF